MRRFSRVLIAALPAALVGCSLLVGVDGLTGGVLPERDGGDGGDHDAGDGGDRDSTTISDGGPGDGSRPCAVPHTFCDDFDDGGLGALWDMQRVTGGTLTLDTTTSVTPPQSLLATASPSDSGQQYDVALFKSFSGSFSNIHCEFDVLLGSATPPVTGSPFGLNVSGPASSTYFVLWNVERGSLYQEFDPANLDHPISLPFSGKWTRIAVELQLATPDAGQGLLTLWYDGAQVASLPTLGQPSPVSAVRFDLGVALGYAPLANPWRVHFDDAWCDVK